MEFTEFETGVLFERERLIKLLMEKGTLRKAMFAGPDSDWYVLYTENGAVDISGATLTNSVS